MVIQVYAPIVDAEEADVDQFYKDLEDILRTNIKNIYIHHWGLECKSRKSRVTWSNRQVWPWSTKWSRAKANWILPREFTGHSKHLSLNNTRDDFIHGHHQIVKLKSDFISCRCRRRSCIHSAKTRPGADCGSDNQLLIANFRLKPQKVGKTARTSHMT